MRDEEKSKEQLLEELKEMRRLAQGELSRSSALLSRVMETSPAGIVVLDRNGTILAANLQATRVLGLARDQITGLTYNDPRWRITDYEGNPFPDDHLPFRRVMESGRPVHDVRHAIERPDGQRVLLAVNAAPLLDESGQVEQVVVTVEDVTFQVQTERDLRQSRKEWEEIFQAVGHAAIILDKDHTIVAANRAAVRATGLSESEIIGKKCYEVFHGTNQPATGCPMEKLLDSGIMETVEMEMEALGGVFLVSCTPILDERGNIQGIIHIATDITERKRAEEDLEQSFSLLKATLESTADGLLVIDRAGKIVAYNQKFAQMWRIPEAVLATRDDSQALAFVLEQLADPDGFLGKVRELYGQPEAESYDLLEFRDGRFFERYSQPQRLGQTIVGRVWSFRDVTQRKQAEEALRESREDLNRAQAVAHTGSWRLDTRQNKLLWSDETHRIFGIPRGTPLTYESFLAAVYPEDREIVDKKWAAALQGEPYDIEHRILVQGTIKWVRERAELEFDSQGLMLGGFGTVQDITARKQAEEDLRTSESFLNSIFNYSPYPTWISDDQGTLIRINQACQDLLNITAEEVVGKYNVFQDNIVKQQGFLPLLQRVFKEGETIRSELTYDSSLLNNLKLENTVFVVLDVTVSPIKDARGRVTNAVFQHIDITERKQAEEALRDSEAKHRLLFESNPQPLWVYDLESLAFLKVNRAAMDLYGYSREEFLAMTIKDIRPPEDVTRLLKRVENLKKISPGLGYSAEWRHVKKSGEIINVEIISHEIAFDGRRARLVLAKDITARKAAEEALRKSEEKYRLLVNQLPAVVYKGYRDWGVDFFDNKIETLSGYSKDDFKSRRINWDEVILPEDLDYAKKIFVDALKSDGAFVREHRIRRKDGDIRWVQCRGQIMLDAAGKIDHISGVTFDITERKQAEEELRNREAKLHSIFRAAPTGIGVVADRVLVEVNDRVLEMTGYSAPELLGQSARMLYPTQEEYDWVGQEKYRQIMEKGTGTVETHWRRKDGSIIEVLLSSTPIVAGDLAAGVTFTALDITERKIAEEALRESEEKYRLLVNQIPAVVFKGYPDWSAEFFDNKIETLTGYSKEEFDSRRLKWSEVILEDDLQEVKRKSLEVVKAGARSYEREYRIRKKDGGIAWIQAMGQVFYDAAGKFDYVSGVFFDITERKRAEEALLKYEFIANAAKDCMTLIDRNYVYQAANASYCQAQGKSWEELVGAGVTEIWGADKFGNIIKGYLDQCFAGQAVEFEGWFEFGKQGMGCYHVFYNPCFAADGTVAYAAVVSHDITGRKRVEDALRRSEVKYRQLVDQIPAVVYRGYVDWSLDCFDQKIEDITGYSMEEFNFRRINWRDLIFTEDIKEAKKLLYEALKGDGSYVTEHRIRKKTGEVRWIQSRNRIIQDAAGKIDYISGVFFDITERKELEDQLIKAQRMEAIGILAGGVAHDFNNLLTAIIGYSEIMMMDLHKEDPFHLFVEEITKAANRGASLTNQLLAFSRKQIMQPQVINLNEVVIDMEKMLRRLIGEDINLLTGIDQNLGAVKGDPAQIEQIIMNLVVNARDAMPNGGKLTIETANVFLDEAYARSHVDVAPGPYVMLAVTDNGMGMDAETASRIFEPFYTTKESAKGTGLGLATVYGIVKQSDGHIWVYSEPGHGTTFKIFLPRVEKGKDDVRVKIAPVTTLEGIETILLVEDDAALRELISTALRRYGFTSLEAAHGGEALLICESHKAPIHLLLTDVVMPQISGTALAERLRQLQPEMKVLYMSGYTENAIVHHGVLDSKVNFIPKPFRVLALVQKVREVLDSPGK